MNRLVTFPQDLYEDTYCEHPLALYPTHSVHSETSGQRSYLSILAKNRGYEPPRQTCCSHHVTRPIKIIQTRLPSRRLKAS